jgi:hypothetical protein
VQASELSEIILLQRDQNISSNGHRKRASRRDLVGLQAICDVILFVAKADTKDVVARENM